MNLESSLMEAGVNPIEVPSLEQFLRSAERRAYRVAEIATRNRADALDIVQDAMLKLVEKYSHKPAQEWNMLFQSILHSRIIDFHRRKSSRTRWLGWLVKEKDEDENDLLESLPDPSLNNPEKLMLLKLDTEIVIQTLQKLPLRQQQAFLLRVWEDMDGAQTAAVMGCTEGSVKTHLFRAMNALRSALAEAEK